MAQTNFTPISLYYSTTAAAVPTAGNLVAGELAINTADGKLFYKDSSGVVQTIASKDTNSGTFTNLTVSGVASFADGTVSLPSITNIGDTNTGIFFPAADTIAFTEGGVESMRIDSSGNVGIGTVSPAVKLHVQATQASMNLRSTGTGSPYIDFYTSSTSLVGNIYGINGGGLALGYTNGSEGMRIDSAGNVGIGNAIPSSFDAFANKLVVGTGSGSQGITVYSGTTGAGTLSFADGTSGDAAYRGYVYYNHSNDSMSFYTAGANQRAIIDSSGNVGIGTSSPNKISASTVLSINTGAAANYAGLDISTADAVRTALYANNAGSFLETRTSTPLVFGTNTTERMRINSAGNVGIGVVPNTWNFFGALELGNGGNFIAGVTGSAELDVGANAYFNSGWKYSGSSAATLYQANNSNNGSHVFYGAAAGTAGNAISWTNLLTFSVNNSLALQGATSQSGTGITFPATQNASSNANTLDDYEEGTWTPVDASGASLSFSGAAGTYVKIGFQVTAWGYFIYPSTANGNNSQIGGLPFTSASPAQTRGGGMIGYSSESTFARILGPSGATTITPYTAAGLRITNATFSGDELYICVTYFL